MAEFDLDDVLTGTALAGDVRGWLAAKALSVAWDVVVRSVYEAAREDYLVLQVDVLQQKLDAIARGPYYEALTYLRMRDYQKAEDALIKFNSYRDDSALDLQLNTLMLLAALSTRAGRLAMALDYYYEILLSCGSRRDIVPVVLVDAYIAKLETLPFTPAQPATGDKPYHVQNFRPAEVLWSRGHLVILWRQSRFWSGTDRNVAAVIPWSDTANTLFEIGSLAGNQQITLVSLTDRYLLAVLVRRERDGSG